MHDNLVELKTKEFHVLMKAQREKDALEEAAEEAKIAARQLLLAS